MFIYVHSELARTNSIMLETKTLLEHEQLTNVNKNIARASLQRQRIVCSLYRIYIIRKLNFKFWLDI